MPEFDYIIVGAGSAGGVLTARVREDADFQVLLIEAEGRADHWSIRMPAALPLPSRCWKPTRPRAWRCSSSGG